MLGMFIVGLAIGFGLESFSTKAAFDKDVQGNFTGIGVQIRRDSVTDMLMQTKAPVKAIVGPWNHSFPNNADFGPRVEWRDHAVRSRGRTDLMPGALRR